MQPLHLPQQLAAELRLSPEQFELVCQVNPDAVLELSAGGHLITMTPTGSDTSARNPTLGALLWLAIRSSGLELKLSLRPPTPATPADAGHTTAGVASHSSANTSLSASGGTSP